MKQLIAQGVIPAECRRFGLILEVNKPAVVEMEVFISEEEMQKIADALEANPEEAKALVKRVTMHPGRQVTAALVDRNPVTGALEYKEPAITVALDE